MSKLATSEEALALIEKALTKVKEKPVSVTPETDLLAERILDSLDHAVFLLETEKLWGERFPAGDAGALDEGTAIHG